LQTVHDDKALNKILDAICDKRVNYHEVVKLLALQQKESQQAFYEFIIHYINYYGFLHDVGDFVNDNMDIASTCRTLLYTLDEIPNI
jgi:hypothetical protein